MVLTVAVDEQTHAGTPLADAVVLATAFTCCHISLTSPTFHLFLAVIALT